MKKHIGSYWVASTLVLAGLLAAAATVFAAETAGVTAGDAVQAPANLSTRPAPWVTDSSKPPVQIDANCTFTVLPQNNSTSGNGRAPITNFRFIRTVYLLTAAELAANGLINGAVPTGIGWNYQVGPGIAGSAPLTIYLQNTGDATNTKSTTWATAIGGMQVVHTATTALPSTAGPFDITFAGGAPFTYTGGGLYVAFDWGQYTGTLTTAGVIWCNTALINGLLGNQSNTAAPLTTVASNFRPETRFTGPVVDNDISVDIVANFGSVPLGLAAPLAIQAVVTNKGSNTATNVPVTLTISGAESFTDTQVIPSLVGCGGRTTVTFASFPPTVLGSNTATVTVPNDDANANNSGGKPFDVVTPTYSYKYPGSSPSGGVGFNGASGAFVGRFKTVVASSVTHVTPEFFATGATTYRVAIYGDGGTGTPGALLYQDAANRTVSAAGPITITLPSPVPVGPGNFFVGIQQTNTINASISFDTEAPIRGPGSFFLAGQLPPTTWVDFAPGNNFKLNIGITLDRCNITPTAANNGPLCNGATLQLTASAAGAGTYHWTGPDGFVSDLQNPTISNVTAANAGDYTVTVNGCASGTFTTVVVNGPYTISASAGPNGSVTPLGDTEVNCGDDMTYLIEPDLCYSIADVLVDGNSVGVVTSYTFDDVAANHTISATFVQNTYTIAASAGPGGTITPSGNVVVNCDADQGFVITANVGYQIADVLVDGSSIGPQAAYNFTNVGANHTIAASFVRVGAVIAAQSIATYTCASNCTGIAVDLSRDYTDPVLAFSVKLQLSPNLVLCNGTASIQEGTFLSSAGGTLFNVVDNGGGSYTVDGAVFGTSCGPTATTGNLFRVFVTSSAATGTGTLTLSSTQLKDCSNAALPVSPGAPGTIPIDNTAPVVTVTSPNGGESWPVGSSQSITWTASDNVGVADVDIALSTDGGATYPHTIATAVPNSGSYAWMVSNTPSTQARVRVTAHDVVCTSGSDASDADFSIVQPVLSIGDASVTEGNVGTSTLSFVVSLSFAFDQPVTVAWNTADGTAKLSNNDYIGASGTVTFAPNDATPQIISVQVNGDVTQESNETVLVNLSSPVNATIGDGQGAGLIMDDDGAPQLSIADVTQLEGSGGGSVTYTFTVSLTNPSAQPITVHYQTADGSATEGNFDYAPASGTLTIPAKTLAASITVVVISDNTLESDETFLLNLSSPTNATIGDGVAVGTIQNDDVVPTLSINDVTQTEGNFGLSDFVFTITFSNPTDQPVTLHVQTANGSAIAPGDYVAANTNLTIPAKTIFTTFTVKVRGDVAFEGDENFFINLTSPTNATIADGQGVGTILEDEVTATLLSRFEAQPVSGGVQLVWAFAEATDLASVWLERGEAMEGPWSRLEAEIQTAAGVSTAVDRTAAPGTHYYRLVAQLTTGRQVAFAPVAGQAGEIVADFALARITPNPTPEAAVIEYTVARETRVKLSVVDLQGRTVAMLHDGLKAPGRHQVTWNATGTQGRLPAGVYFVRYEAAGKVATKRLLLAR